uniref:Uncharacterized protein n=1 Tax=Cacopsylla melanoneura TaxID=428564 RepID=A0A8D8WL28_9HEMI
MDPDKFQALLSTLQRQHEEMVSTLISQLKNRPALVQNVKLSIESSNPDHIESIPEPIESTPEHIISMPVELTESMELSIINYQEKCYPTPSLYQVESMDVNSLREGEKDYNVKHQNTKLHPSLVPNQKISQYPVSRLSPAQHRIQFPVRLKVRPTIHSQTSRSTFTSILRPSRPVRSRRPPERYGDSVLSYTCLESPYVTSF